VLFRRELLHGAAISKYYDAMVPWRVKKFLAFNFPLAYATVVNRGLPVVGLHDGLWLADLWDDPKWEWPLKNELLTSLTQPTDRILDLGTGTGGILRFLQQQHGYQNLAAADAGAYPIRRLGEMGIDARQGVLPDIPFDDASFDFVIASQVLEHIVQRRRFMREIQRVLVPGGRLAIFVPDWCLSPADEPSHVAVYRKNTLNRFLSRYFLVNDLRSIRDPNHGVDTLFALASKRQ
jgi:SAM-dependent methyltransferase